jgi:CDP-glucose 4,6-dehydratase
VEPKHREVESVVIDPNFWKGRRVFLTGHTGFKGSWTALLLGELGAQVTGFALPPDDGSSLFEVASVADGLSHGVGDLRDAAAVSSALAGAEPEIVIHMGAQSLVRRSYAEPVLTFATNVMGTAHVLDAARRVSSVQAVVVVTSDKCYADPGLRRGYVESDPLGGHDPYSSSKGCAELVASAYRSSVGQSGARIATARAGNVIGGGDWAQDRLVPDAIRAFMRNEPVLVRNPHAVRPWQHVLDPVLGYLLLAERLVQDGGGDVASGWNFGPDMASDVPVSMIVEQLVELWVSDARWRVDATTHPHEAPYLRLDCSKAQSLLHWRPAFDLDDALRLTVECYRAFAVGGDVRRVVRAQIDRALAAPRRTRPPDQAAVQRSLS